jgi:tol-pal system protein YbgF
MAERRTAFQSEAPYVIPSRLTLACLTAAGLFAAPVLAQSGDTSGLIDRLERMERELTTLQRQVYRGGPAPAPSATAGVAASAPVEGSYAAQAEVRFSQLDGEMRQLTGKVEELGHHIDQLRGRLEKLISDVDFRLRAIEQGGQAGQPAVPATAQAPQAGAQPAGRLPQGAGANPGQAPSTEGVLGTLRQGQGAPADAAQPAATQTQQQAALPAGSPEDQYKFAFDTLARQRDYAGAERAFRAFIKANPRHGLAGNAQYWLGETHYARKEFDKAAMEFAEGFKKYPKDSKAPDNVLKLGMALSALNQTAEACKALQGYEQRFPGDGQNLQTLRERAARERQRMACK